MRKPLIFLGGVVGRNPWRQDFIKQLVTAGVPEERIFDPVVPTRTTETKQLEAEQKAAAYYKLYYIAKSGKVEQELSSYGVAEAVLGACRDLACTVIVLDYDDLSPSGQRSLKQIQELLESQYAQIFTSLEAALQWLLPRLLEAASYSPYEEKVQEGLRAAGR
jgi:hypothetical protein